MPEETTQEQQQEATEEQPQVAETQDKQKVKEQVEETSPKKEESVQPQVHSDLSDEDIDKSDAPQSLKTALKRANRRLRRERQSRAKLEDELRSIKNDVLEIRSNKEGDTVLKEIESELGLSSDQTKKFYGAVDRIVEKKIKESSTQQPAQATSNLTPKQSEFAKNASQEIQYYPEEDRANLSKFAQDELLKEMQSLQNLGLDPNEALDEDPRVYISRGYKAMTLRGANSNQQSMVNKTNAQTRAGTESSRDGIGRSAAPQKMTQELFNRNRNNPEWIKKNRNAILEAARRGDIRGR